MHDNVRREIRRERTEGRAILKIELCEVEPGVRPEALESRFQVSHGMLLAVLGRPQGGCRAMKDLVKSSLESKGRQRHHGKHAIALLRSLWQAGVIEFRPASEGGGVSLNAELQRDFSILQALGLYVVDAVERLELERRRA